jgi:putative methanogen marker protein 4
MRIAAGVGENQAIIDAANLVNFEIILTKSENILMDMLFNGDVDAAVRGSLNASQLKVRFHEKYPEIFRASYLEVDDREFLLAPVGIDEGDSIAQKKKIIEYGDEFLRKIGLKPKIAVLSGGRSQDRGRSFKIDQSINDAEELITITRDKYPVKHYFILIEDALADGANLILAPDGICGNLIFRSLVFMGSGKSHGAITLGTKELFIDTSRSQNIEGYIRALKFAAQLVNLENQQKDYGV